MNPRLSRLIILTTAVVGLTGPSQAQTAAAPAWETPLRASLEEMAEKLSRSLKPWPVPDQVFRVEDFGAVADGATLDTLALQKTIDACSAKGGGVVLLSKGDYVTGTIDLKSGVMLEIAAGARLLGSTNLADYPDRVPARQTVMDTWMKLKLSLIYAENCDRVGIRGAGVIDGRGLNQNFPGRATSAELPGRPFLIRVIECRHVVIDHIHLRDSASWMQNYLDCDDLILQNVNVENQGNWNNDGFDIDGCRNVIVRDCFINAEDDAMCFKGAGLRTMENVLVENCTAYSECNALKFGTDSQGNFRNVVLRNIEIGGVPANLPSYHPRHRLSNSGVSWESVDGGTVENILVANVRIVRADAPIFLRLGDRKRVKPDMPKPEPGILRHLIFDHVTGEDIGALGSIITGIPGHRVQDVVIRNFKVSMRGGGTTNQAVAVLPELADKYPDAGMFGHPVPALGFWIRHAENIYFDNILVTPLHPDARPEFAAHDDVSDIFLDGKPLPSTAAQ
jgi:polygalacturonase